MQVCDYLSPVRARILCHFPAPSNVLPLPAYQLETIPPPPPPPTHNRPNFSEKLPIAIPLPFKHIRLRKSPQILTSSCQTDMSAAC